MRFVMRMAMGGPAASRRRILEMHEMVRSIEDDAGIVVQRRRRPDGLEEQATAPWFFTEQLLSEKTPN